MRRLLALVWLAACSPAAADESAGVAVVRDSLIVAVDVTGTLAAVDSDAMGPPPVPEMWNFKIAMMAPEGEAVAAGAPVLAFDASELEHKLAEKIAERDAAATQLGLKQAAARVAREDERLAVAEAEAALRKATVKADAPPEITAVLELEKARLDAALAREKVDYLVRKSEAAARRDAAEIAAWRGKHERAVGRVEQIQTAIGLMTVKATRAGTVIHKTDWEGNKKKIGDAAWRAETVVQVVSLAAMKAEGEIDEVDLGRVALDQPVALRLDAQSDLEIAGRVVEISQTVGRAAPENPLKVARVEIALADAPKLQLRPGMRFRGRIETARIDDALVIPLDVVVAGEDGPQVRRRTATGIETVAIEIGARDAERVVVLAGLDEGDVLVSPLAEASP